MNEETWEREREHCRLSFREVTLSATGTSRFLPSWGASAKTNGKPGSLARKLTRYELEQYIVFAKRDYEKSFSESSCDDGTQGQLHSDLLVFTRATGK